MRIVSLVLLLTTGLVGGCVPESSTALNSATRLAGIHSARRASEMAFPGQNSGAPAKSGAQKAPTPEEPKLDSASKFPAPPKDLYAYLLDFREVPNSSDDESIVLSLGIGFFNQGKLAFDALDIEVTTKMFGKTARRRAIVDGNFADKLAIHTGSILPFQSTATRWVNVRIPLELYAYGRETTIRIVGARPASRVLDVKSPDSVWVFMATATGEEVAAALKAHPELLTFRTEQNVSPLLMSCAREETGPLEAVLAAGGSLSDRTKRNLGPLHFAAMIGETKMIKRLVAEKLSLEEGSVYGQRPIHVAVLHLNGDGVKALVAAGADVNARDDKRSTALMLAPSAAAIDMAKILIELGADLRAVGDGGVTYMGAAAAFGQIPFLELGVQHGVKVTEAEPKTGLTPLHFAARYGRRACVAWLLDQGADLNAKTVEGDRPIDLFLKADKHPVNRRFMEETFATHGKGKTRPGAPGGSGI